MTKASNPSAVGHSRYAVENVSDDDDERVRAYMGWVSKSYFDTYRSLGTPFPRLISQLWPHATETERVTVGLLSLIGQNPTPPWPGKNGRQEPRVKSMKAQAGRNGQ